MTNKKVLVTGGGGYLGVPLCTMLLDAGYKVTLLDRFYFGQDAIADIADHPLLTVVDGDVRNRTLTATLLSPDTDVIHLASLSNDPSCDLNPRWSHEINYQASVDLAQDARKAGCGRFLFASSCSVYGFGSGEHLKETSLCNPVSLYAELKVKAESEILELANDRFCPVSMRQATLFGQAPRMRFDLAINQMTMHAFTKGKIYILGGGKQWRPFLHVRDSARIFASLLTAKKEAIHGEIFNAGADENNFQIEQLAQVVKACIPGTLIEVVPDDADRRDYNVDFSKITRVLGFKPQEPISRSVNEILEYLKQNPDQDYTSSAYFNVKRVKETGADVTVENPSRKQ